MSPSPAQFTEFVADIEPSLRRALAEEFGPIAGREATIDALAFAWANWDRVVGVDDATAYLLKVGETAAERHRPLATGDVTPILPRSLAAFDALVPPVSADEAVGRADELVSGAPTTMLARPAPTTVVATTPLTTVSAGPDGAATRPALGPPGREPPLRRTLPWVVAVVLVGVIALGGIAFANRSSDDGDGADTTSLPTLPTLPTTVAPGTTPAPATESTPPAATSVPTTETPSATQPEGDDDDDDDDDDGGSATSPAPAATSPTVTTPPATDAPVTDPPVTDPPETDPPETDPPSTPPPSTAPPSTTVPPRPTAPNADPGD